MSRFVVFVIASIISCVVINPAVVTAIDGFEEAKEIIVNHLKSLPRAQVTAATMCSKFTCCNITASESCSIEAMPQDQTTLVLPGGETRCIYSYSTPFAFQVVPGLTDKLLINFQDGGACWNQVSTYPVPMCTTDSSPYSLTGIFDRTNNNNHFKDFSVVNILYCSGDVFGGNVTRPYNDKTVGGQPIKQTGIANAQSALRWIQSQQDSGALATTFSELIVSGASAGAIGTQIWAKDVLKMFNWKKAAAIVDSYAGIFPPNSQGPLVAGFGYCSFPGLSANLLKLCLSQQISLQDIELENVPQTPSVPYFFLQSKVDLVQQSFYVAIGATTANTSGTITPTQFYSYTNDLFSVYTAQLPNFLAYMVNGGTHMLTPGNNYYTTDPLGSDDNNSASNTGPMLYSYLSAVPMTPGVSISSQCEGNLQSRVDDNTYCSSGVIPHTYTQN